MRRSEPRGAEIFVVRSEGFIYRQLAVIAQLRSKAAADQQEKPPLGGVAGRVFSAAIGT
jgi:hypothetical protein